MDYRLTIHLSCCWPPRQRRSSCHGLAAHFPFAWLISRFVLRLNQTLARPDILKSVPSTSQLLILSPFTPKYTIHNSYLNVSTTVTVKNFDPKSVQKVIPEGTAAYVANVTIDGKPAASRCHFDFYDTFKKGGNIEITLTADKAAADDCLGALPESLSTGGFSKTR